MKQQILNIAALLLAAIIVMIFHEFPKAVLFQVIHRKEKKFDSSIFLLQHYIDPIGLLFCVMAYAGFSKPYMYRIKSRRTNTILGMTGFFSLAVLFITTLLLSWNLYGGMEFISGIDSKTLHLNLFIYHFWRNVVLLSGSMFLVNLFPVSTFDMGLIIAGKSPTYFFSILQNDYIIKCLLIVMLILNIIPFIVELVYFFVLQL